MQENFSPKFFAGNRARLREAIDVDLPVVITANGQLQASSDNPFPFQQDPGFWYLCGVEQPDYVLVMSKNETYIIAPSRSEVQDMFDGIADHDKISASSGVDAVLDPKEGWSKLRSELEISKRVCTLQPNPAYIEIYGMYTNPARARLTRKLRRMAPKAELIDIRPELSGLRVVKQTPEIAAIRKAVDIHCATLNDVRQNSYAFEYELEADISRGFRSRGAHGHSFSPIVAGGVNACTFHYLENNAPLLPGNLALLDTGVKYGQYASDLTRTWSMAQPTVRQQAVFDAVNDALEYGISLLKPGKESFYACEQKVRGFVGEKLKELGLIDKVDKEGIFKYYPHAPHYLGLDVHDVGDTRLPIQPNMVMTLEPGIYIPDEGIGIRIEEDILITENGCEVLSKACPRTLTPVQ